MDGYGSKIDEGIKAMEVQNKVQLSSIFIARNILCTIIAILFIVGLLHYYCSFIHEFVSVLYVSYCILFEINKIIEYLIIRRDE